MEKRIYQLKVNVSDCTESQMEDYLKYACDATKGVIGEDAELLVMPVRDEPTELRLVSGLPSTIDVKFKKLSPDACIPSYNYTGDMGLDMKAISMEYDAEHDAYVYHTGLAFESPMQSGSLGFVRSSNSKTDCYLANHVGVLDTSGYRGEIIFKFKNRTAFEVRKMMAEWKYMNQVSDAYELNGGETISDTVEKMKSQVVAEYKEPDPMDYAPYKVGEYVAQMVFITFPVVILHEVDELTPSERGERGFGSREDKEKKK